MPPSKLGGFITGKNTRPDLTEERLRVFNIRNEIAEARYSSSSPYYKGLTDYSRVINRESFAEKNDNTSSSSSSSSRVVETAVFTKMKTKTTKNDSLSNQSTKIENTFISKPLRERDSAPPTLKKPLRERDFRQPPIVQASLSPPPTPPLYERERVYIWGDKYRPFRLNEFLCNREKAIWLQGVVRSWQDTKEECRHFIFEGKTGAGKRTMVGALLREAFGEEKVQATQESKIFPLKGEAVSSIRVNLMVSTHHVEVNLSELKGYEKHVIVELIKEKNQNLSATPLHCNQDNCKAIILHDADKLSADALSYIKWMIEKFKGCNKVFFCCRDAKKLKNVMPLCIYVQLNEPSTQEIVRVLEFIAEKEGIHLPHQLAYKIASNSQNNLRQAIRSFEATWFTNGSLIEDQDIKTGWEDKIANIAKNIVEEQSPKQLYNIRGELQNLIEHNVAPEFIFQTLKEELKKILPQRLQTQFNHLYDEYQNQNHHGSKKCSPNAGQEDELQRKNVQKFMRIEEIIARFMSWYKGLVVKNLVV